LQNPNINQSIIKPSQQQGKNKIHIIIASLGKIQNKNDTKM
jgi:hypothetical protein